MTAPTALDETRGAPALPRGYGLPDDTDLRIDPVCGQVVNAGYAPYSRARGGATYHFCGPGCRARFDAEPGAFTGDRGNVPHW
ncbi:MAG: YHS domain-containing protein [Truepera sp.]|jgi:Cu+-exporting ATPase|nr:YHS domain-containing protein [Truepera sp.]